MPKITGKAKRLRIYIGESDRWKGHSLFEQIVKKAKELDMAGVTVCRGLMGYGANSRIHTAKIVDLSCDLPIIVEMVDSVEYIEKFLLNLDEMVSQGLVTLEDIDIIKYDHQTPQR